MIAKNFPTSYQEELMCPTITMFDCVSHDKQVNEDSTVENADIDQLAY